MTHKGIPGRQTVIDPPPQKAHAQHKGCLNPGQAFFKIGGILLCHPKMSIRRDHPQGIITDGIEVADHHIWLNPFGNRHIRATIRSYQNRGQTQRKAQQTGRGVPAAKQCYWFLKWDNLICHAVLINNCGNRPTPQPERILYFTYICSCLRTSCPLNMAWQAETKGRHPMIGASKILTVSYGTFSCTLEGFDEPFSTMKAIAEYFRDLAADDRYFGAEPPTPDAEMLHRIAEREIHRRVEAKINDHGVVLRQTDVPTEVVMAPATIQQPAVVQQPAVAQPAVSEAPVVEIPTVETTRVAVAAPAPAAVVEPVIEAAAAAPEPTFDASQTDIDLATVVAPPMDTAEAAPAAMETAAESDAAQEDMAVAADLAQGVAAADEPDLSYEISLDAIMAEAAADRPGADEAEAPTVAPVLDLPGSDEPESIAAKLMRIRAVVEGVRASSAQAFDDEDTSSIEPTTSVVSDDFGFDLDLSDDAPDLIAAEAARAKARSLLDQPTETDETAEVATNEGRVADAEVVVMAEQADETIAALPEAAVPADAPEAVVETDPVSAAPSDDALLLDRLSRLTMAEPTEADEDLAPAEIAFTADDHDLESAYETASLDDDTDFAPQEAHDEHEGQSLFQRARARVIRLSHSALLRGSAETPAEAEASVEAETDVEDEAYEALASADDAAPASEGRAILEAADHDEDGDLSRLMDEAKAKLEGAENRRRFSAISHLKAAVAATLADRKMHTSESPAEAASAEQEEISLYREDLSKVVRPRRPAADPNSSTPRPTSILRPAPLVLVSEQRVDLADGASREGTAVRPRRVAAGNLAVSTDDDDDLDYEVALSPESASSFADFAEKLGAVTLTELLEAAAVYTASVEGHSQFTRPHLLRKVEFVSSRGDYNREDGLRSFGMLLRQGKIQKVSRGQFSITESSKLMAQTRNVG